MQNIFFAPMSDEIEAENDIEELLNDKINNKRRRTKAFRRAMHRRHNARWLRNVGYAGYNPWVGYVNRGPDGSINKYVSDCSCGHGRRYVKTQANRRLRRKLKQEHFHLANGKQYRKTYDVWWTLF